MSDLLKRLERSRERRVNLDEVEGRKLSVTLRRPPQLKLSNDVMEIAGPWAL